MHGLLWVVPIGQVWAHIVNQRGESLCGRYTYVLDSGKRPDSDWFCHECESRYEKLRR